MFRRSSSPERLSTSERRADGASHPKVAGALLMVGVVLFLVLVAMIPLL